MTNESAKSATETPSETRDLKARARRSARRLQIFGQEHALQISTWEIKASGILVSVYLPSKTTAAVGKRGVLPDSYAYDYPSPAQARAIAKSLVLAARQVEAYRKAEAKQVRQAKSEDA